MQILILLLFTWLIPQSGGQDNSTIQEINENTYRIALSFIDNPNFSPSEEQMNLALKAGITLLEITRPDQAEFANPDLLSLLYNADIRYTTAENLREKSDFYISEIETKYRDVSSNSSFNIAAIGIFTYPADFNPQFRSQAAEVADSLVRSLQKPVYYQSFSYSDLPRISNFSFAAANYQSGVSEINPAASPVIRFNPSNNTRRSLLDLETLLNGLLDLNETLVLLPAPWFFEVLEKQPGLSVTLNAHISGERVKFPLPAQENLPPDPNWEIILLIALFAGLISLYKYQPVLIQYSGRYFFNHSFFVADIMDGRLRNMATGLIFLGIHSLLTGLFFYTSSQLLFSSGGLKVLSEYFPVLFPVGFSEIAFFAWGTVSALVVHCVSIFWLFILNKQINQLNKAVNLYSWMFLLNIFLVSILVILKQVDLHLYISIAVIFLFLLTWFLSFNIAAVNGAKFLEKYRFLNLFLTAGLYSLILIGIVSYSLLNPYIYGIIELALRMP